MPRLRPAIFISFFLFLTACSDSGNNSADGVESPAELALPAAYRTAQRDFIDNAIADKRGGTYGGLLHIAEGLTPPEASFDEILEQLNGREDTADFGLPAVLTLLAKHTASEGLDSEQRQLIEDAVINFKFWPDELEDVPGTTDALNMVTWTENHYILFASGGYIAGQLYPDRLFPASGRTGREQMAAFKPRILRWLELRYRSGFSEWLSNVYYNEDIPGLMALIDLAEDEELANKSRIVLDLIMADMALNNFQGNFGSTHGRTYGHKMNARRESTRGVMNLAFGLHTRHTANISAIMMALSEKYHVPEVLKLIATDVDTAAMESRQRMGIRLEEAANWGLNLDRLEDGMLFLTMEPYTSPNPRSTV